MQTIEGQPGPEVVQEPTRPENGGTAQPWLEESPVPTYFHGAQWSEWRERKLMDDKRENGVIQWLREATPWRYYGSGLGRSVSGTFLPGLFLPGMWLLRQGQWSGSQLGPVPQTRFHLASPKLQLDAAPRYTQKALQVRALDQKSGPEFAGTATVGDARARGWRSGPVSCQLAWQGLWCRTCVRLCKVPQVQWGFGCSQCSGILRPYKQPLIGIQTTWHCSSARPSAT